MNNPFYYTPSTECLKAVKEVTDWLYGKPSPFCDHPVDPAFRAEIDKGKMFGVLIVEKDQKTSIEQDCNHKPQTSIFKLQSYIAGYSGQVCGRSDWQEFVPAVFDYLQPDGYFKQHEEKIVGINNQINALQGRRLSPSATESTTEDPRPTINKSRLANETEEEYIHRRQFENAELHRWKLRQRERDAAQKQQHEEITSLKTIRRKKSDDLQRWLFSHFRMRNGKGETQDLLQITQWYRSSFFSKSAEEYLPPAGSGECCEPKLLQYAFTHGLKPVSMAMFWWGESPKGEIRQHLHFYPACNSKCKPILKWMLQGIDVDPNTLESQQQDNELASKLRIIYEDESICVISKPEGLLSVPGKTGRTSVYDIMRQRYPDADSPLIVHRLDMATSGIMVIAKTMDAYHNLQQQFAAHTIKKRYVALLENNTSIDIKDGVTSGIISLPLRPDLNDRPRQMVDFENGRKAVTYYKYVDNNKVWLWPQTGRTHQLRVHCAHKLGLNNPIKGDTLYGTPADRLYLHAAEITFSHPVFDRQMHFIEDKITNEWH